MEPQQRAKGLHFYAIGLSYKKTDANTRGLFSITPEGHQQLLLQAKKDGLEGILAISTCNRTEVYGFAKHPYQIIKLLCEFTKGTLDVFEKFAYILKNDTAVLHLHRVGAGMDSQILGDFEIIGQLKRSFLKSKAYQANNPFLERLVNSVIHTSKRIKNETALSTGATSVSYAAVQYMLKQVQPLTNPNILLFGTGKIGRNTCENLVKHTKNENIFLINRTQEKAQKIAGKFNLIVVPYDALQDQIQKADVLIVATGAFQPTVVSSMLNQITHPILILDLSMPRNVEQSVSEMPNVQVVHLDDLNKITDHTLAQRVKQLPLAQKILEETKSDFDKWLETRKYAPTIHALQQKLTTLKNIEIDLLCKKDQGFDHEHADLISSRIIQKITNHFANHLKEDKTTAAESIELIQKVFNLQNSN